MTDHVTPKARVVDLDVVRAVALIGVCLMNYHGYLILRGGDPGDGWLARVFDPWTGWFSTRFAATFVTVAGMGVALMTNRAVLARDRVAIGELRWRLIRRGVLLYTFGFFLDWVWPGTILFYYGAFFFVAAFLFTLRSRWLLVIGAAAAVAAAGLQWWALDRSTTGDPPTWLFGGQAEDRFSPRDLVFDTFVRGTHPLLPWLAFLCIGMVFGRRLPFAPVLRVQLLFGGVLVAMAGYLLSASLPVHPLLRSTHPFDRSLLYTATAAATAVVAVVAIGWLAEATSSAPVTRLLAVAGRTTLTIYVLHVLVFNLLVDWLDVVQPGGLATSMVFALLFWVLAILLAEIWHWRFQQGPLEWVYRRFSD
ncbi:MAG: DUF418 domain-containing protein [Ilumatobacteraceae bacterium]